LKGSCIGFRIFNLQGLFAHDTFSRVSTWWWLACSFPMWKKGWNYLKLPHFLLW
jgi:hypothetical protein